MNNTKSDRYFLSKILLELNFIIEHTKEKTIEEIENNIILLKSIMFSLIQISEHSDKLSTELKNQYKDVSWRAMKGMRNRIVHDYGNVDIKIIFYTCKVSVPEFFKQIRNI